MLEPSPFPEPIGLEFSGGESCSRNAFYSSFKNEASAGFKMSAVFRYAHGFAAFQGRLYVFGGQSPTCKLPSSASGSHKE